MTTPQGRNRRTGTGIALLLLGVAAIAYQRGATRPWLQASPSDGTVIVVTPVGVTRTSGDTIVSECRWWPRYGNTALCAGTDGRTVPSVRRAYPLTIIALWSSIAALFVAALAVPRRLPGLPAMIAAATSLLAVLAVWSMGKSAPGLQALAGSSVRFSGSGIVAVGAAAALTTLAALLLLGARRNESS